MLSPTVSIPPSQPPIESANVQPPSTRRRGLSYLRSLSSHHSSTSPESPRSSPRNFFVRSTSYQEAKNNRAPEGRRRSQSHARSQISLVNASSTALARVATSTGVEPSTEAETAQPSQDNTASSSGEVDEMGRRSSTRRATTDNPSENEAMTRTISANGTNGTNGTNGATSENDTKQPLPMIRFYPHQDQNRTGRQSLNFAPISRTLPTENAIIRVGRYSEREGPPATNPTAPSDAPVGFKSKVVSRKHCEFCFVDGQWQIRDVCSSSGTFLNHIRLSQPNQESKLYPIKDGDIVQLGIDFRGGEEMIFRCVKIRIECNRSWQKKPNTFNKSRQAQLRGLASDQPGAGKNDGECTICLGNVLPCQALFIAPCAHIWHYKCIKPVLEGRSYPQFQCPNCRAYSDLEADVDVDPEDWNEDDPAAVDENLNIDQTDRPEQRAGAPVPTLAEPAQIGKPTVDGEVTMVLPTVSVPAATLSNSSLLSRRQDKTTPTNSESLSPPMTNIPMPSRPSEEEMQDHLAQQRTQTEMTNADQIIAGEGPLTPRNNAGPFVFDGSGTRIGPRRVLNVTDIRNLDEISDGIE